jgi:hypothetical protein
VPNLNFKVGADISGLKRGLAEARREVSRGLGNISLPGIGGGLLRGGIGATVGLVMKRAVDDYVKLAGAVQKFGATAQASAERASTLIGVAQQLGIETSTLEGAFTALKTAVANHPEQFKALGIALEGADGRARKLIDVFADLRARLAGATKDAGTLQVAQELLGGAYDELLPLLGLTNDELAEMGTRVSELGGVIDQEGIQKAQEWQTQVKELELNWTNFTNTFGQFVVPGLINGLQGLGQAFDTFGSALHDFWENNVQGTAHALSGGSLGREFRNPLDVVGEAMDAAQRRHDQLVARQRATAAAVVNAGGRGSGPGLGFATQRALGGGRDAVADAIHDQIDAIRDQAKTQEQATRDALEAYTREREGAIDTARKVADAWDKERHRTIDALRAEEDASQRSYRARIDQMREAIATRERERNHAIAAIREEIEAESAAFDAREEQRSAEREVLEERLRAIDEQDRAETAAAELRQAQDELAAAQADEPVRVRSESLEEFQQRHDEWVKRVADAEKRLAEVQAQQSEDAARAAIEAQIRALDNATSTDRKEVEVRRATHDEKIALLETEAQADRERTDDAITLLQKRADAEKEQFDARIALLEEEAALRKTEDDARVAAMQKELEAHTQQVNDELEAKRRETDATISELQKQLEAHQRTAQAIRDAHQNINRTITYTVVMNGAPPTGIGGGTPGLVGQPIVAAQHGLDAIVGPGFGGPRFIYAGEGGAPEEVHIGPVGRGRGGGREELHVYLDGKELNSVIARRSYRDYRINGGQN